MRIRYVPTQDERGSHINALIESKFPQLLDESNPELLLICGGDGAILHAIQDYNHMQLPYFGYANGTLNFLMNKVETLEKTISDLLSDKIKLDFLETTSIKVTIKSEDEEKFLGYAVNEVILGTSIMGYHHYIISSEDNSFDNFEIKGSGLSICTDLGSTGYNFSLGGSVLPIGSNLWSVNGIVCNRFLEDIIKIQNFKIELSDTSRSSEIYLDGVKKEIQLTRDTTVCLSKGEVIKIGFLDKEDFFKRRLEIISRYRR